MLQAKLKVVGGKHDGKVIPLSKNKFLIGREQDCHLRPNTDLVSRHHCVFALDDYAVRLRDLGSTNGTFVNGERLHGEVTLTSGDRVRFGTLEFEVLIPEPGSADEAAPAAGLEASVLGEETAELSASDTDTMFDFPIGTPGVEEPAAEQPPAPAEQPPAPPGQLGGPPPTDYQQPTFYPPQGAPYQPAPVPYGQPPVPYGQPTPYPQYPYGYPPQPGMPYPPPGASYPQGGSYAPQGGPSAPPQRSSRLPEVRLPDPETTGAGSQSSQQNEADAQSKEQKPSEQGEKPSEKAADIIRNYMQRRPDV